MLILRGGGEGRSGEGSRSGGRRETRKWICDAVGRYIEEAGGGVHDHGDGCV